MKVSVSPLSGSTPDTVPTIVPAAASSASVSTPPAATEVGASLTSVTVTETVWVTVDVPSETATGPNKHCPAALEVRRGLEGQGARGGIDVEQRVVGAVAAQRIGERRAVAVGPLVATSSTVPEPFSAKLAEADAGEDGREKRCRSARAR